MRLIDEVAVGGAAGRGTDTRIVVPQPDSPGSRLRERRSNRLARGLVSLGVLPGDLVVVLCCETHREDRAVGYLATLKAGATPVVLPVLPARQLRARLLSARPRQLLACGEGLDAWRASGVCCQVIGDEPGMTWWKMLEARQSPLPFQVSTADGTT